MIFSSRELLPSQSVSRHHNPLTFPIIDINSRTTWLISTKLSRHHAWGMGIQICSNNWTGLFWGPIRGKIRTILINLQKSSSHEPLAGMH